MNTKKFLSLLLAGALATSVFTGAAFAEQGKNKNEYWQKLKEQKQEYKQARQKLQKDKKELIKNFRQNQKQLKQDFKKVLKDKKQFIKNKQALKKDILKLKEKMMQNNKPVTYAQALTLTVRAMGYDLEGQAKGYVTEAVYLGIVSDSVYKPHLNKPLTRANLAELLVRAKGETVNESAYISSKDAAAIPAAKMPYVALAVEKGWLSLTKENLFRPNKPVTRAEFVTALMKAGFNTANFMPKYYEIKGTLVSTSADPAAITLDTKGTQVNYAVYGSAKITVDGKEAALSDLKQGMNIKLRIADNVIVEIKASSQVSE